MNLARIAKNCHFVPLIILAYGSSGTEKEQEVESKLKSDIMTIVNQVNPIDQTTGQRKYISFGFISDIHFDNQGPKGCNTKTYERFIDFAAKTGERLALRLAPGGGFVIRFFR